MPSNPPKPRPNLGGEPAPPITVESAGQFASDEIHAILTGINKTQPMQIAHCKISLTAVVQVIDIKRFGDSDKHESTLVIELELEAKA